MRAPYSHEVNRLRAHLVAVHGWEPAYVNRLTADEAAEQHERPGEHDRTWVIFPHAHTRSGHLCPMVIFDKVGPQEVNR